MPEVKGLSYRIFWGYLFLAGAQQNVALNRLRYKVAIPLPRPKNGLHAVDQPLAFELHERIVNELIAEGLPVLQPYLPSSVKIRESHEQSLPMIYMEPNHKLTLALVALHGALRSGDAKTPASSRRSA